MAAILYGPGSMASVIPGTSPPMPGYDPVSMTILTSSPSKSPSLLTAARTSKLSSRACPEAVRFSPRASTHLTGWPRSREAAATASSSRETPIAKSAHVPGNMCKAAAEVHGLGAVILPIVSRWPEGIASSVQRLTVRCW
jgi:hypothetical protein